MCTSFFLSNIISVAYAHIIKEFKLLHNFSNRVQFLIKDLRTKTSAKEYNHVMDNKDDIK